MLSYRIIFSHIFNIINTGDFQLTVSELMKRKLSLSNMAVSQAKEDLRLAEERNRRVYLEYCEEENGN